MLLIVHDDEFDSIPKEALHELGKEAREIINSWVFTVDGLRSRIREIIREYKDFPPPLLASDIRRWLHEDPEEQERLIEQLTRRAVQHVPEPNDNMHQAIFRQFDYAMMAAMHAGGPDAQE